MRFSENCRRLAAPVALTVAGMLGLSTLSTIAADGGAELKQKYSDAVTGKTIAFLPMTLGAPLMDTWEYVIRTERGGYWKDHRLPAR